jgi:cytidylate kinase
MYGAIAEVISGAAGRAPAVFIGRCADRILREARIRLRSVFIYSTDTEGKIARAVDVDGIDRRHAESHIAKMDKARTRYQQFFTQTTFGDPREYDLCLNSAQLGYEGCVATIMASMNTDVGPSSTPSV